MENTKKSFLLHFDQQDTFEALPPKYCKELILAIFDFAKGGTPKLSPYNEVVFIPFKQKLIRENEKWVRVSAIRSKIGKKGAEAKASNSQQKEAIADVSVSDSVSVNKKKETPRLDFAALSKRSAQVKGGAR